MSSLERFDVRGGSQPAASRRGFESLYSEGVRDLLHGTGRETFEAVKMLESSSAARLAPANGTEYPSSRFGESLRQIAQLIRADVGLRIAFADVEGWDTHVAQFAEQGWPRPLPRGHRPPPRHSPHYPAVPRLGSPLDPSRPPRLANDHSSGRHTVRKLHQRQIRSSSVRSKSSIRATLAAASAR